MHVDWSVDGWTDGGDTDGRSGDGSIDGILTEATS